MLALTGDIMWDESELDDMERLALAARRDPEKWGARYLQARREEEAEQAQTEARG